MKLELNGLDVMCVIGERPEERTMAQRLRLDIALAIPDRASATDDLADTVDYAALADSVRRALVTARCRMIERAARIAAEACLADARVSHVTVRVTKYGAIAHLESASATFSAGRDDR